MPDPPHVVANRREVVETDSIYWGDENETPWESAIQTSSRLTITENNALVPRRAIPGTLIGTTTGNQRAIYDISDGSVFDTFTKGDKTISDVALTSKYFAYSTYDPECYVFDLADGSHVYTVNESGENLSSVALSDEYFVYSTLGGEIYIHDLSDGSLARSISKSGVGGAQNLVISNSFLAAGDNSSNVVHVFDLSDGSLVTTLSEASDAVWDVDISGNYVAYAAESCYVHNTSDWSLAYSLDQTEGFSNLTSVSLLDSQILYGGGTFYPSCHLHDLSDGSLIQSYSEIQPEPKFVKLLESEVIYADSSGCYVVDRSDGSVIRSFSSDVTEWDYLG